MKKQKHTWAEIEACLEETNYELTGDNCLPGKRQMVHCQDRLINDYPTGETPDEMYDRLASLDMV